MFRYSLLIIFIFISVGCSTSKYEKDIPVQLLTVGMSKSEIIETLGQPHKINGSKTVKGINYTTWVYQKYELIWITGNSFLGGTTRNERTIYLIDILDGKYHKFRLHSGGSPQNQQKQQSQNPPQNQWKPQPKKVINCTKFGDTSGRVYQFTAPYCPTGYFGSFE